VTRSTKWSDAAKDEAHYDDAYKIARVLHVDDETAARIAAKAVAKLPIARRQQDRRFRYDTADSARTRSYADDSLLLTKLALTESEFYERDNEAGGGLSQARLFQVRVVKHLINAVLDRNSFYAAVAVGRIIHDYKTPEVMRLYDYIAPRRSTRKETSHFRRAKAVLMKELLDRFGAALKVEFDGEGGKRFVRDPRPDSDPIFEALGLFAPRRSAHLSSFYFELPRRMEYERRGEEIWNDEMNRLHALIDPACFRELTTKLGLEAPSYRLTVPKFNEPSAHDLRPEGEPLTKSGQAVETDKPTAS